MSGLPRFFGHRGARAIAPENTIASLRRAIAGGADGLEFDVRATRDGTLVLLHDVDVDRTTNGRGPLNGFTREELVALDAGGWFASEFAGARIPSLDEVLDEFLGKTALDIELKETLPKDAVRRLGHRVVGARLPSEACFVTSFDPRALEVFAAEAPGVARGLLLERGAPPPSLPAATHLGLSMVVAHEATIDAGFARDCLALGMPLFTYTVNDVERARTLAEVGVSVFITDDPRRLKDEFGGSSAERESSPERV